MTCTVESQRTHTLVVWHGGTSRERLIGQLPCVQQAAQLNITVCLGHCLYARPPRSLCIDTCVSARMCLISKNRKIEFVATNILIHRYRSTDTHGTPARRGQMRGTLVEWCSWLCWDKCWHRHTLTRTAQTSLRENAPFAHHVARSIRVHGGTGAGRCRLVQVLA